jgi:hypothetical protein
MATGMLLSVYFHATSPKRHTSKAYFKSLRHQHQRLNSVTANLTDSHSLDQPKDPSNFRFSYTTSLPLPIAVSSWRGYPANMDREDL